MTLTTRFIPSLAPQSIPNGGAEHFSLAEEMLRRLILPDQALSPSRTPLRQRISALSESDRQALDERWGHSGLESLLHLSAERDPELFCAGLLHWARSQEQRGRADLALATYSLFQDNDRIPAPFRERALERLAVFQGRGSFGAQTEHFLHETVDHALSPASLLAMAGAGLAFRSSRLLFLRVFSEAGLARTPLSLAATGAAFNIEALSFPLLGRLSHQALGHHADWSSQAIGRDLASSYLFLGGMRAAGFASTKFFQWGTSAPGARQILAPNLGSLTPIQNLTRLSSMYGGVVAGNYLESLAGLREFDSPGALLAHSLGTFIQFQLAGRMLHAGLGPNFRHLERRMDQMALGLESIPRNRPRTPSGLSTSQSWNLSPSRAGAGTPSLGGNIWMAMSHGIPGMTLPAKIPEPGLPLGIPESISPPSITPLPEVSPSSNRFTVAAALVQHRGSLVAAAHELGMTPESFEHRLKSETNFSELSVFQSSGGGRMLFYRPALSRAHSVFGNRVYQESSLAELSLSPPVQTYLQGMGIHSVWDLLLTSRGDFIQARREGESKHLVATYLREIELNFDHRVSTAEGKSFRNHPIEEGIVKSLMAQTYRDYPISNLGLEPSIESNLIEGGMSTVGQLLRQPIPRWIPRERLPEGSAPGTREMMSDSVIRSLFALLHGAPPRRYRAPQPDRPSLEPVSPLSSRPELPPVLAGVTETGLLRHLIASHGNLTETAQHFSHTPEKIAEFIQRHNASSELNIYQGYGKGTMLFYTPSLRLAVSLWGDRSHRAETLQELGLSESQSMQLRALGVESVRDIFLLTRFDFERRFGTEEAAQILESLDPLLQRQLNREGLQREHVVFRPGVIKEAISEAYAQESLETLSLPAPTLALLQSGGIRTLGDLMNRPIPEWIRLEQLESGSHPAVKAEHIDRTVRATYAHLLSRYRFPARAEM